MCKRLNSFVERRVFEQISKNKKRGTMSGLEKTAVRVGVGTVAGVGTALANQAAPHVRGIGTGAVNASANFSNAATKAMRQHGGISGAIAAGTAAVVGHGAAATVIVAAAPVALGAAVVGGVAYGLYRLFTD
jgi:hypothetical protein